jgi:hypothetical protein
VSAVVKLWLTVYPPGVTRGAGGDLYTTDVELGFLPADGEQIELWALGEDNEGPLWAVRRRYWDVSGTANLTLLDARIDTADIDFHHEARWSSADGDLVANLLVSGWRRY